MHYLKIKWLWGVPEAGEQSLLPGLWVDVAGDLAEANHGIGSEAALLIP